MIVSALRLRPMVILFVSGARLFPPILQLWKPFNLCRSTGILATGTTQPRLNDSGRNTGTCRLRKLNLFSVNTMIHFSPFNNGIINHSVLDAGNWIRGTSSDRYTESNWWSSMNKCTSPVMPFQPQIASGMPAVICRILP